MCMPPLYAPPIVEGHVIGAIRRDLAKITDLIHIGSLDDEYSAGNPVGCANVTCVCTGSARSSTAA